VSRFVKVGLVALLLTVAACDEGVSDQRRPIGTSCATSGQCGTGKYFCSVGAPDGDCEAECSRDGDCPVGSVCVGAGMIMAGACHADCTASADCRAGYVCTLSTEASHAFCEPPPAIDGGGTDAL
jgi:hypothetical protein